MTIKRALIYVSSAVIGALIAAGIFSLLPSAAPSVAVALGIAETYKVPTAQELIDKYGSQVKKSDSSIALGPDGSITVPVQGSGGGSTGGNSGVGSSGSSGQNGGASGGQDTNPNSGTAWDSSGNCFQSQAENPTMYAACRAGYVPPQIVWRGITACTPIDKSQGTWSITYRWEAVGGNWKGYWNGAGNAGTVTTTFQGNPGEAGSYPILQGNYASIMITDMRGTGVKIDEVFSSSSPGTQMNTVCH